jgi:hypothetical protein
MLLLLLVRWMERELLETEGNMEGQGGVLGVWDWGVGGEELY